MRAARRPQGPGLFAATGWVVLAGVIATGQLFDRPPAESIPEFPAPVALVEPSHDPVTVVARPPADAARLAKPRSTRPLPKPFAAVHRFASPLIMPRLALSRVLTPRLAGLSRLLTRARPGEPVAVTLTAYCLDGLTRRGRPVRPGIIAADPHIFPLARYVELFAGGRFLGRFLVDDTGGRIHGTHIDIWTPDCDDARHFGMRTGVATLIAHE